MSVGQRRGRTIGFPTANLAPLLTFAPCEGVYAVRVMMPDRVYPGAANNINADRGFDVPRYAIEVKGCYSHNNTLGYSGTAGDSVWAHDNRFTNNTEREAKW